MEPGTTPFDSAGYLGSEDDIVEYINAWMEDGSPREIARALGDVARSKGVTAVSAGTGAGQQALFAALSEDGNPALEMLTAALDALGLELCVKKKAA